MSQASEIELLMLDLINEERTSRGLEPLAINANLNAASEDHSTWMLDTDTFSHTGVGGSSSRDRIEAADYELTGSWRTAENIGWQSERGDPGIADDVTDIHQSLMNSPGHSANILNPDLEEIGIGIETGDYRGYDAVMVTQNFGTTDAISDVPEQDAPVIAETDTTSEPIQPATPQNDPPVAVVEEPTPVVDLFDFCDVDNMPDFADDAMLMPVSEGTVTTQDQGELNAFLDNLFADLGIMFSNMNMDFG